MQDLSGPAVFEMKNILVPIMSKQLKPMIMRNISFIYNSII